METLLLAPIAAIAFIGLTITFMGVIADSKAVRRRVVREERKKIIDAITKIKPLAGNPDIRETKQEIINAITKRGI
jgi:hypothetical protein